MGIFGNKRKPKVEWTEKTAPKESPITLEFKVRLIGGKSDGFYVSDSKEFGLFEGKESFLCNTDSSREIIKEELSQKLEELYNKMCAIIDNDSKNFSDEFWASKKEEDNN